jgi:hypothetical protein
MCKKLGKEDEGGKKYIGNLIDIVLKQTDDNRIL